MKPGLISIVVPVYNAEKYLKKCLDSLINQTYKNLEIICVNDGSCDNSYNILKEYAHLDSRIIVINQENRGASEARNAALDNASGEYIMFVDSDDYIELETCELAIAAAEHNHADLVFWSYVREFGDKSKEKHFFWEDGTIFEGDDVKTQLHRRLCGLVDEELAHPDYIHSFESLCTKLYRANYIFDNNIRFVDIKKIATSEDGIFNLYALQYVKKAVYIKKAFYHYNKVNDSSLTTVYKDKLFSQRQTLDNIIHQYIEKNALPKDFYVALKNRIALNLIDLGLNIVSSDFNLFKKNKLITEILATPEYKEAYKQLKYRYFPLHWKVFFLCAKLRFSFGVYLLLVCIKMSINKNKIK